MKLIGVVIREIEQAGGKVVHNSLGGHSNKQLTKLIIRTDDGWMFNAWFDFRSNEANAPCYGPKHFIGCLKFLTIDEQLNELVHMIKNKLPSKLLMTSQHEIIGY